MLSFVLMLKACFLGVVQGVTEFLPISSSAHVFLLTKFLGDFGPHTKAILTFLQGISGLAIVWLYRCLIKRAVSNKADKDRDLLIKVVIACLPFLVVGFLLHKLIFRLLFSPLVIGISLILGGVVLLFVDKWTEVFSKITSLQEIRLRDCLGVGITQLLALIPGVSRSGSTIVAGMFCGLTKSIAVEFSFLVAMPILFAVSFFQVLNVSFSREEWGILITSSFVTLFVSLIVIKPLLSFLSRRSLCFIGTYRILFGFFVLFYFYFPR